MSRPHTEIPDAFRKKMIRAALGKLQDDSELTTMHTFVGLTFTATETDVDIGITCAPPLRRHEMAHLLGGLIPHLLSDACVTDECVDVGPGHEITRMNLYWNPVG